MEQTKSDQVIRSDPYTELTVASLQSSSRHMALMVRLSELAGRSIVVKPADRLTGMKRKYALLDRGTKVLSPIVPVNQSVVFWSAVGDGDAMLFVGDLKWVSMREALNELLPVKLETGKSNTDLIVLEGFKLAPDWLLVRLHDWCVSCVDGRPTSEDVLKLFSKRPL